MSTIGEYVNATFHLHLRLKGDPKRIELFHAIMWGVESDWPWKPFGVFRRPFAAVGYVTTFSPSVQVCNQCLGIAICNPRINPGDIAAAARQVGIKAKIDRMSDAKHCWTNGRTYCPMSNVSQVEGRRLYQHKPSRYRVEDEFVLVGNETVEDRKKMTAPILLPAGFNNTTMQ
jgi:hypothetical protein